MPVDSASFADLKDAVAAVLRTVPRIGTVETLVGGTETWLERKAVCQAFWEISIFSVAERSAGVGPIAFENVLIRIEGFMNWGRRGDGIRPGVGVDTEKTWDTLLDAVRIALRTYPTLGAGVLGIRGSGLPQLRQNTIRPYSDIRQTAPVHYCLIELEVERKFSYTVSAAIP